MRHESTTVVKKEVQIDIGGGTGEYLSNKARENPDKTFVTLEPFSNHYKNKPLLPKLENLYTIVWKSDVDSHLPFSEGTVSEASANFLMGELRTKERESQTIDEEKKKYRRLIEDIKNVLRKDGKLRIVDVKGVIDYVVEVLNEAGFRITLPPRPMQPGEKNMSAWSAAFFNMSENSKKGKDSLVLPMVLEATKM